MGQQIYPNSAMNVCIYELVFLISTRLVCCGFPLANGVGRDPVSTFILPR